MRRIRRQGLGLNIETVFVNIGRCLMALDEKVLWKALWEIVSGPSKYDFGVEGLLDRVYPTRFVTFKIRTLKGQEDVEFEISSIDREGRADDPDLPGVEGHWWYFRGYVTLGQSRASSFWKELGSKSQQMVGIYSTKLRRGSIRPIREEEREMLGQIHCFPPVD